MTDTNVPPGIGVQLSVAVAGRIRVNLVGDRVVVAFGDDLYLMGDPAAVHELVVEADRQLTHLRRNGGRT
jgi:hypothetical protein